MADDASGSSRPGVDEGRAARVDELWLIRHGATEWSIARRHTGRTDIDLVDEGARQARRLGERLREERFDAVFSSPLIRARRTARLAGFTDAEVDRGLLEWDYGDYEGLTGDDIRAGRPGWDLWTDGCPGGESPQQVFTRADAFLERADRLGGRVLVFGHGHMCRATAARYVHLPPRALGKIEAGSICVVGLEAGSPAVARWNLDCHPDADGSPTP
ncbi:MAG: histidine phosphatase family protein [Actinomycetota bacterium]